MASGYTRSPKLLKGALIEFSERFIGPLPNIIIFQYNPEKLTRTLSVYSPGASGGAGSQTNPASSESTPANAQPDDPTETFSLPLELDATDDLESSDPIATLTGVYDRMAALEILLYPQESLLGGLLSSISASLGGPSLGGAAQPRIQRRTVPIVLFVWGPGRILPVRLTSFSVEEIAYSPLLYPIQAKVTLGLRVLTATELQSEAFNNVPGKDIALSAYNFTKTQKRILAAANIANTVESILGMLPF
jgi:hypothetical protein